MEAIIKDEFYIRLGKTIKQCRRAKGLSQEKLSKLLGVSRPSLANIETGRQRVYADTALRIAELFEIDFNDVLTGRAANTVIWNESVKQCDRCNSIKSIFISEPTQ